MKRLFVTVVAIVILGLSSTAGASPPSQVVETVSGVTAIEGGQTHLACAGQFCNEASPGNRANVLVTFPVKFRSMQTVCVTFIYADTVDPAADLLDPDEELLAFDGRAEPIAYSNPPELNLGSLTDQTVCFAANDFFRDNWKQFRNGNGSFIAWMTKGSVDVDAVFVTITGVPK